MPTSTHYTVLGLSPAATDAEVRDAYRRLARQYHPDRAHGSAAGGDRMPAINEAYRVLSDPGRRAVYDASLRGGTFASNRSASTTSDADGSLDDEPGDEAMRAYRHQHPEGPPRIPWRVLSICTVAAIIFIVVLAQFTEPGEPAGPDGILRNGDCVEVLPNNDVDEVACEGAGDLVVRQFIAFDRVCSNGWAAHRDRQGMGIACIEERPVAAE